MVRVMPYLCTLWLSYSLFIKPSRVVPFSPSTIERHVLIELGDSRLKNYLKYLGNLV